MNILLFGKTGQVGWELQRSLNTLGDVVALDSRDTSYCADFTNLTGLADTVATLRPDIVVNAAAYTAVDRAESEKELAALVNASAVEVLAKSTAKIGATLVHYSTDYVFDGNGSHFRTEDEETAPINWYGQTKRDGELAILANNPRHLILRTSWVYASRGSNFIKTMLRLGSQNSSLKIIDDQFGAPTGAELIADSTALALRQLSSSPSLFGIYHLVASGSTTWYEFARFIFDTARELGYEFSLEELLAISSDEYKTPAKRPLNSRLDNNKFKLKMNVNLPDWKDGVVRVLSELKG
ncbi:dTDP-4-dehydrorhamnose reductase [Phytobacter ursingii]|uniref:dTDP-4-dehydrorhamnose reductase n=1 Tax=Phytobacter ursingii TaxID=1972431 RepID=UPI000CD1919A|nr:dTDP-4-dehydrorhamnose reductase [Enterobacteriaceae bacterium ENNIH1]